MKCKLVTVFFMAILLSIFAIANVAWAQATLDTVSIYDLQWVPDPASNDASPYVGDTVVVKGLVMNGPEDLWVGTRWAAFVVDPDSFPNPWSGFFIIQHDTISASGKQTGFQFLQPGDVAYFTGVMEEFSQFSEMNLYGSGYAPNPVIPVDVIDFGVPLPNPVTLTASDLTQAQGEQWESMYAKVFDATITNNLTSDEWAIIDDPTGTTYIGEYFLFFYLILPTSGGNGTYVWPPVGTRLNVQGFLQDAGGSPGQVFTINPRDTFDLELLTTPPTISGQSRDPGVPISSDMVDVQASIVDPNGVVTESDLMYSVDWGPWQTLAMTATADTFSATIPMQPDGSFVRYFIYANDNDNHFTTFPGDTSDQVFFYVVRDGGLSISDVQYDWGYPNNTSGFDGYEVTVSGVVLTDPTDFPGAFYIEENDSMWSGMLVFEQQNFNKGDWVEVTGTVDEYFLNTTIINATQQLITPNFGVFSPVLVTTEEISNTGANSEAYESVFLRIEDMFVTNPFPNAPGNFGEFIVSDGSGDLNIQDDFSTGSRQAFQGNLDSTYGLGDYIAAMEGLGFYSFGNYDLMPRDTNDVIGHTTGIGDNQNPIALTYELSQNYPNPFNPVTDIEYRIASSGNFSIEVYNILGQKIRTLINAPHQAGAYKVQWDGTTSSGVQVGSGIYFYTLRGKDINLTRKMILLK